MAGIIKKHAVTPITIRCRTGIVDGKPIYSNYSSLSIVFDSSQSDSKNSGVVHSGKVFLIPPGVEPLIPGEVICNGKIYTIKTVKTYRNLKNILIGYRVAVSGA